MSTIKRPISELNKQEFDQAYEEMCAKFRSEGRHNSIIDKGNILNILLQMGQITMSKLLELSDKMNTNETTS